MLTCSVIRKKSLILNVKKCDVEFVTKRELESHMKTHIGTLTKQYNCNDCAFQGENGLELKRHIQRTQHVASDYIEECYTCKQKFASYWQLMNHRKIEHPSSKKCRYFQNDQCKFDEETCWYKHESKKMQEGESHLIFQCNACEKKFLEKSDLMKHKKTEHAEVVSKCRAFDQGNCFVDAKSCWFVHEQKKNEQKESEHMDVDEEINEQVFCEGQEKTPPDQMMRIMKMINKLSIQVEKLEKMSLKGQ